MTQYAYKDNAVGRLSSPLDSADMTAVLQAGQGANFPTVSVAVPAILTVVQYSVPTDPTSTVVFYEKIKVTVKSTDTLTITERGVGDTSAHDFNAGDYVYLNITEDFVTGVYDEIVSAQKITTGNETFVLTGSIDPTASTSVTGVGTIFESELAVGDRITVSGETRTVTAITSNTALTVDTAFSDNANDTSVDVLPAISLFKKSDGTNVLTIQDNGRFGFGTPSPNGKYTFVQGNLAYDNGAGFRIQSSASADRDFLFFFTDETNHYSGIQAYADGASSGAKPLRLNALGGNIYIGGNLYSISGGSFTLIADTSQYMEFQTGFTTRNFITPDGAFGFTELASTPNAGSSGTQLHIYVKGDKLIFQWNDGGTVRYKYITLSGTSVTWTHTTTAP